jgi:hypothetical protein
MKPCWQSTVRWDMYHSRGNIHSNGYYELREGFKNPRLSIYEGELLFA